MGYCDIKRIVDAEIYVRDEFRKQIMELVYKYCYKGTAHIQKLKLWTVLYNELGFYGKPGPEFSKYFSRVLLEAGFESVKYEGLVTIKGLMWYDETRPVVKHDRIRVGHGYGSGIKQKV